MTPELHPQRLRPASEIGGVLTPANAAASSESKSEATG